MAAQQQAVGVPAEIQVGLETYRMLAARQAGQDLHQTLQEPEERLLSTTCDVLRQYLSGSVLDRRDAYAALSALEEGDGRPAKQLLLKAVKDG